MARELIGYFAGDMSARDIARAIIEAHRKRKAREKETPTPAKDETKP
jgi:hypothetical protein